MVFPFYSLDLANAEAWMPYHYVKQCFIMILASVSPVVNDFRGMKQGFLKSWKPLVSPLPNPDFFWVDTIPGYNAVSFIA